MFFNSRVVKFHRQPSMSDLKDRVALIKEEPMLFRATIDFARQHGGPITQKFIDAIPQNSEALIDSRFHMLFPGMYPCIPGYHHDYVPRDKEFGQPDYKNPEYRALNLFMVVNSGVAPTVFAEGTGELPDLTQDQIAYKIYHPMVEDMVNDGTLKETTIEDSQIYKFDDRAWHKGVPAVKRGWRFFIRATYFYSGDNFPKAQNEIRTQSQVYLPDPFIGW